MALGSAGGHMGRGVLNRDAGVQAPRTAPTGETAIHWLATAHSVIARSVVTPPFRRFHSRRMTHRHTPSCHGVLELRTLDG
jgi:hypothetical protein